MGVITSLTDTKLNSNENILSKVVVVLVTRINVNPLTHMSVYGHGQFFFNYINMYVKKKNRRWSHHKDEIKH